MRALTKVFVAVWSLGLVLFLGVALFCLSTSLSRADTLELQEAGVSVRRLWDGGVDPLVTQNRNLPNRGLGERLELNLLTSLCNVVYWDTRVHSATDRLLSSSGDTTSGQFRLVGLEMGLGVRVTQGLRLGYYHHSQHVLDAVSSFGPFPREDGLEVRFLLYKSPNRPDSLF